jgi:6-phosphogluconolactonase (cycloisomerase 2 family)
MLHPFYIGCYTNGTGGQGIYWSTFNSSSGALSAPTLAVQTTNPSYVICPSQAASDPLLPSPRYIYAVNEISDFMGGKNGSVSSFRVINESSVSGCL